MKNKRWGIPFLTCLCGAAAITAYSVFWPAPAAEPPLGKESGRELIAAEAEDFPPAKPLLEQQPPGSMSEAAEIPLAEREPSQPKAAPQEEAEPPRGPEAEPVPALDPRIIEILTAEQEPSQPEDAPQEEAEPPGEPEAEPVPALDPRIIEILTEEQEPEPQPDTASSSGGVAVKADISQLPDTGSYWYDEQASQELMRYINELRISLGLNAMIMDDALTFGARIRNVEQRGREISHTRPDGRSCFSVLIEDLRVTKYKGMGENLAWRTHEAGTAVSAYDLYMQWVNSPGHYELMIDPSFTHFGVNVLTGPYDSYVWQSYATALFYR